jgi:hypothetical protein
VGEEQDQAGRGEACRTGEVSGRNRDPMRIIHCTQKLLKELSVSLTDIPAIPSPMEGIGNWYSNLIRLDSKKCLLFTNEKSLYSFLIPAVVKTDLRIFPILFLTHLYLNLQYEDIPLDVIRQIQDEYKEISFAKTASKHVLGAMNQLAFEYKVLIEMKEGLGNIEILEMNRNINRTIMKGIKYQHPIEALRELLPTEAKE